MPTQAGSAAQSPRAAPDQPSSLGPTPSSKPQERDSGPLAKLKHRYIELPSERRSGEMGEEAKSKRTDGDWTVVTSLSLGVRGTNPSYKVTRNSDATWSCVSTKQASLVAGGPSSVLAKFTLAKDGLWFTWVSWNSDEQKTLRRLPLRVEVGDSEAIILLSPPDLLSPIPLEVLEGPERELKPIQIQWGGVRANCVYKVARLHLTSTGNNGGTSPKLEDVDDERFDVTTSDAGPLRVRFRLELQKGQPQSVTPILHYEGVPVSNQRDLWRNADFAKACFEMSGYARITPGDARGFHKRLGHLESTEKTKEREREGKPKSEDFGPINLEINELNDKIQAHKKIEQQVRQLEGILDRLKCVELHYEIYIEVDGQKVVLYTTEGTSPDTGRLPAEDPAPSK